MPIITTFTLPHSVDALVLPQDSKRAFFITFTTSNLPETGESWCPDVRAALPLINAAFSVEGAPDMAFVEVGQRPEYIDSSRYVTDPELTLRSRWKVPSNVYRTTWNVNNVPTVVRYERVDGRVKETGRLVEGEILDEKRLKDLLVR